MSTRRPYFSVICTLQICKFVEWSKQNDKKMVQKILFLIFVETLLVCEEFVRKMYFLFQNSIAIRIYVHIIAFYIFCRKKELFCV